MSNSIVTLSNGKKVANFSSPHQFTFEDGNVLPAHDAETAERLKVTFIEKELNDNGDVSLSFELSDEVGEEMSKWYNKWNSGKVDVVFCPLPMITALHKREFNVLESPFRAIRMVSRTNKVISINKQSL